MNKARAKNGKPPLKRVTRVDGQQYITALQETERRERDGTAGGTHASPRPHLRRAHIRTLANGKRIGIHAMWINVSDEVRQMAREKYKVKEPA